MTNISPSLVKELREKTGAGMMDCKKALMKQRVIWKQLSIGSGTKDLLRPRKNQAVWQQKASLESYCEKTQGAVVEVNAETDFVGRNEQFQNFVRTTATLAITDNGDLDSLKKASYPGTDKTVEEELTHLVATIGENMTLRRAAFLEVSEGVVVPYIHNALRQD